MKKLIEITLVALIFASFSANAAMAADTILPEPDDRNCEAFLDTIESEYPIGSQQNWMKESQDNANDLLGCAIKTGRIHLWMIPYYIAYMIEFIISIIGLVSVLFVMLGGYFYAWGGVQEDKEKGKKTVMYALVGLALAALSWIIVNIIQTQLTG